MNLLSNDPARALWAPECTQPDDRFFNYCLWPYHPAALPDGKWRAASVFFRSLETAGIGERGRAIVDSIRNAMGVGNTVWGVKRVGDQVSWELYFYDYKRRERERSMSLFINAISPWVRSQVEPNEWRHYFMFSVDLEHALLEGGRELSEIHMYIGNVGSVVSSGISYALRPGAMQLENFYFFFDPAKHLQEIAGKISCSAFIDTPRIDLAAILWPELIKCQTVCIANKQRNDCVYFSGIQVDQLIWFLRRLAYPVEEIAFIESNRSRLDHLLFDVGIDYRVINGQVEVLKSAYYGNC
ncbi:hypothetical protein ACXR0O_15700 [Verrucomicrobiota bacterium sgz303538]